MNPASGFCGRRFFGYTVVWCVIENPNRTGTAQKFLKMQQYAPEVLRNIPLRDIRRQRMTPSHDSR
ncbi:MAG: hypothetical protein EBU07_13035 [Betaproteobacteria bacterium]|nr:hypothetical protein [Betaproteobacteria bacterium]